MKLFYAVTLLMTLSSYVIAQDSGCIKKEEIDQVIRNNDLFITETMSKIKQSDRVTIEKMLTNATVSILKKGLANCPDGRDGIQNEVKDSFKKFYSQVGVGGRLLFDHYKVPELNKEEIIKEEPTQ